MPKKRKLSALTTQETNAFLRTIENFTQQLTDEGDEEKAVIASLEHVAARLHKIQHVRSPAPDALTFTKTNIKPEPLIFMPSKIPDVKSFGKESTNSTRLTIEQTRDLLSLIRVHVSFSTEAGCRVLVSAILLHVLSNLSHSGANVSLIPDFHMAPTRFEYAPTSYGDIIDFLIVRGPPVSVEFLLESPKLAFTNPDILKHLSSNIYAATNDGFRAAIPHATMAAASYCRDHSLSTFRGCVTNGEIWVFFVFKADVWSGGGTVAISKEFRLGMNYSGLPLVLGLLSDWIINAKEREQQFFTYFDGK
ncbi:hypothetical protein K439DRAFT_1628944 [Ramaria rubella]|nr:hypothetical protein K439DRAFT_1628944 [Ramaria rubella]